MVVDESCDTITTKAETVAVSSVEQLNGKVWSHSHDVGFYTGSDGKLALRNMDSLQLTRSLGRSVRVRRIMVLILHKWASVQQVGHLAKGFDVFRSPCSRTSELGCSVQVCGACLTLVIV